VQAVRWHARGDVRVEEVPPPPPPGPGEVQLRVSWCGIGGTDLEEWQAGPLFIALGLLGRGAVRAAPLISDRIPLGAAVSGGLALLRDEPAKHVKILVQPEEPA
jgi:NADPH:quinone reductase-like Zn-dependent oxidoreductase